MEVYSNFPCHRDNYTPGRPGGVDYLVIHYVGAAGSARANAQYYHNTPGIGSSAHYFVGHADEDAAVYASVAERDTAWHCGRSDGKYVHPRCRNANSIGIELCCRQGGGGWYFDEATLERGAVLARDLMARYAIPLDRVVRHYDVTGKICPAPFVADPAAWGAWKERLEEDMTKQETTALFGQLYEQVNPLYTSLDQVPDYWRAETQALMEAGAIQGDGTHPLRIRQEALAALVAAGRLLNEKEGK